MKLTKVDFGFRRSVSLRLGARTCSRKKDIKGGEILSYLDSNKVNAETSDQEDKQQMCTNLKDQI